MQEFLLIFRNDASARLSPDELQATMKPWQDWIGGLAAQNKLVSAGSRLDTNGKVVKPGNAVTNGPYVEIKESIGGYIIIRAESLEEAATLSNGCPILQVGGNVEVRQIIPMEQ